MSQERWDVVVRFLNGPLAYQEDIVLRGPVIRIGANPGPGGLKLEGYRGLDDRQAVVTAYDGGTVSIAPVGPNQVRMAPHENVDWNDVQPIRGPVFLSDGCAIHFGPPGRGATATFVECRRLGVWEQRAILSEAADAAPEIQGSEVKELDARKRFPLWIIPAFLVVLVTFVGSLGVLVFLIVRRDVQSLGPTWEGKEKYEAEDVLAVKEVNLDLYKGVEQAFFEFIVRPDAEAAGWPELEKQEHWDKKLMEYTTRAEQVHIAGWRTWIQLDNIREDYAFVLGEVRKAGLPDVLAAIPFQESRYTDAKDVLLCARGFWQFQPETALQGGMEVRDCKIRGMSMLWTPTEKAPPRGVAKNAVYVSGGRCALESCAVDDRGDLRRSTKGAVALFAEVFKDEELRFSGAITQITIASHNTGYDNGRFYADKHPNVFNMLPAYRSYRQKHNVERAPDFIGANITCTQGGLAFTDRCGGYLGSVTQTYVPNVIAQHMLAVCYYGKNYADDVPAFSDFRQFTRSNGYCTDINVPDAREVRERAAVGGSKKK